jgi:RimJ/RimL family protein N-acetyltransferase
MLNELRQHDVHLQDGTLSLRPMTEDDWDLLQPWHNDPEVLYYSEGDDVTSRGLDEIQEIYRGVSQHAFVFMAVLEGRAIGDGWLQEMNLERILTRYPKPMDLRRIDLQIGERSLWGQGWGTRMIGLLTRFGFEVCRADAIFGCCVADYNPRSRRAFARNGYVVDQVIPEAPGRKAKEIYDMVLGRREWSRSTNDARSGSGC